MNPGVAGSRGPGLADLAEGRSVVVCCGPGGVGKTTLSAAVAAEIAVQGRRAVVVTIDPARRLANALGLDSLPDTPHRIEGRWPGELWAMTLDTRNTFDHLVTTYAPTPEQARAILANRFYRNIAGALSGTQEYMAMEKLYELHGDERFDLVVVDTPPTRNALDFVEAPRRLIRFLDNRIFRLLMLPTRASLRAVNLATRAFLRTVSVVVGSEAVSDAVAFFQAFEGMEGGFRDRAAQVERLLRDQACGFVVVSSPRRDAVAEATYFADKLDEVGIDVRGLVLNRLHPRFAGAPGVEEAQALSRALGGTPLAGAAANLAELVALADAEEQQVATLVDRVAGAPVVRVPLLAGDVHDLDGLAAMSSYVFAV